MIGLLGEQPTGSDLLHKRIIRNIVKIKLQETYKGRERHSKDNKKPQSKKKEKGRNITFGRIDDHGESSWSQLKP